MDGGALYYIGTSRGTLFSNLMYCKYSNEVVVYSFVSVNSDDH